MHERVKNPAATRNEKLYYKYLVTLPGRLYELLSVRRRTLPAQIRPIGSVRSTAGACHSWTLNREKDYVCVFVCEREGERDRGREHFIERMREIIVERNNVRYPNLQRRTEERIIQI